jgi:hypothetical protein
MAKSTHSTTPVAARKTRSTSKKSARQPTEQQIRERAYQIFLAEGARPGSDLDNWLRAEQELSAPSVTR